MNTGRRPWSKKDDNFLRREYPKRGSAVAAKLGRTEDSVRKRALRLGVAHAPPNPKARPRPAADSLVTAEMVALVVRLADRYGARHGDPGGVYGPAAAAALLKAARSYRPGPGVPFEAYARVVIGRRLAGARRRAGPAGYRAVGGKAARADVPSTLPIGDADPPACLGGGGDDPVGWVVDWSDFAEVIARTLPDPESDVFRAIYLEACCGGSFAEADRLLGLRAGRAAILHDQAIGRLREALGVGRGGPDEACRTKVS